LDRVSQNKPKMAELLRVAPDFNIELKWEFDSFIPLVGTIAPSGIMIRII
jgi:hypothetical protein